MAESSYTGTKGIYVYTDDIGEMYLVRRDDTLAAIPQAGLPAAVAADLTKPELPKSVQMRYVLWSGICDGRLVTKKLFCNTNAPAYSAVGSTLFDIDGSTDGATTGRVGEKKTYLRLAAAGPATP